MGILLHTGQLLNTFYYIQQLLITFDYIYYINFFSEIEIK